jgi:hypothetical protein
MSVDTDLLLQWGLKDEEGKVSDGDGDCDAPSHGSSGDDTSISWNSTRSSKEEDNHYDQQEPRSRHHSRQCQHDGLNEDRCPTTADHGSNLKKENKAIGQNHQSAEDTATDDYLVKDDHHQENEAAALAAALKRKDKELMDFMNAQNESFSVVKRKRSQLLQKSAAGERHGPCSGSRIADGQKDVMQAFQQMDVSHPHPYPRLVSAAASAHQEGGRGQHAAVALCNETLMSDTMSAITLPAELQVMRSGRSNSVSEQSASAVSALVLVSRHSSTTTCTCPSSPDIVGAANANAKQEQQGRSRRNSSSTTLSRSLGKIRPVKSLNLNAKSLNASGTSAMTQVTGNTSIFSSSSNTDVAATAVDVDVAQGQSSSVGRTHIQHIASNVPVAVADNGNTKREEYLKIPLRVPFEQTRKSMSERSTRSLFSPNNKKKAEQVVVVASPSIKRAASLGQRSQPPKETTGNTSVRTSLFSRLFRRRASIQTDPDPSPDPILSQESGRQSRDNRQRGQELHRLQFASRSSTHNMLSLLGGGPGGDLAQGGKMTQEQDELQSCVCSFVGRSGGVALAASPSLSVWKHTLETSTGEASASTSWQNTSSQEARGCDAAIYMGFKDDDSCHSDGLHSVIMDGASSTCSSQHDMDSVEGAAAYHNSSDDMEGSVLVSFDQVRSWT